MLTGLGGLATGIGSFISSGYTAQAQQDLAAGDFSAATDYGLAANIAQQNVSIEKMTVGIQEAQSNRKIYQTESTERAATGGAGLEGGSAGDLMRSSMQQGALANQLIKTQGNIQENAYQEQVVGYQGMQASSNAAGNAALQNAQAAQTTGIFGLAGGVLGVLSSAAIIGAVASIL